jgi:hypothetical protein
MTAKLPKQPTITEVAPGHIQIDQAELNQYTADMAALKSQWDATMVGAENDPDEIMRRMIGMFK